MSSYIPLSQREQWADITPIPQDDGPDPLVPIMYSTECELPRWRTAVTMPVIADDNRS